MFPVKKRQNQIDPFKDFFDINDDLFGLPLYPVAKKTFAPFRGGWPALDVDENEKSITVKADLPGLQREEIDVSIHDGILTIRGERKSEEEKKDKNYHRVERTYGSFQRSIDLGVDVDDEKVKANYSKGVLELTIPKTNGSTRKRIEIQGE